MKEYSFTEITTGREIIVEARNYCGALDTLADIFSIPDGVYISELYELNEPEDEEEEETTYA